MHSHIAAHSLAMAAHDRPSPSVSLSSGDSELNCSSASAISVLTLARRTVAVGVQRKDRSTVPCPHAHSSLRGLLPASCS